MIDKPVIDPLDTTASSLKWETRAPISGNSIVQSMQFFGADLKVVVAAHLGAIAAACGGLCRVRLPTGNIVPSALFIKGISPSGTGKTPVMDCAFAPIDDFEDSLQLKNDELQVNYRADLVMWSAKERALKREEKKCPGFPGQLEDICKRQGEHEKVKPQRPTRKQLLFEDASAAAFVPALKVSGYACIASSEGGNVLNDGYRKMVPMLNALYSGSPYSENRGNREPIRLSGESVSVCVLTQRGQLESVSKHTKKTMQETGYNQRTLVFLNEPDPNNRASKVNGCGTDAMELFELQMKEHLEKTLAAMFGDDFTPAVLEFDIEAKEAWLLYAENIELQKRVGGLYEYAADHAAKLTDNVGRVAALLHFFECGGEKIPKETLDLAIDICGECSADYMRVFAESPEHIADAETLYRWLIDQREMGRYPMLKSQARRNCPTAFRQSAGRRFHAALKHLESIGSAGVFPGTLDGKDYILFRDDFPPSYANRLLMGMDGIGS